MKLSRVLLGVLVLVLCFAAAVRADRPWSAFLPFKKASVTTGSESYILKDAHGPWLILAASFAGEGAEVQARELAQELRQRHRLDAYVYSEEFDYTDTVEGLTINEFGERKKMKYANAARYDAIAVLVGDFPSVNDPDLEETLETVKYLNPECLDLEKNEKSTQRFAGLRHFYRRLNGDVEKQKKGPMGSAFVTRNPMLPAEYFAPGGVDEFVASLNQGVEHSLLKNKGAYTVRVATFRGDETIDAREIAELESSGKISNKLELAADRAHRLTVALRKEGEEAYEFHDRHESVVCVGSFESEGTPLADGSLDIHPGILRVMQRYGAQQRQLPGASVGFAPKTMSNIAFDVQPLPMKVPRRSITAEVARGRGLFR